MKRELSVVLFLAFSCGDDASTTTDEVADTGPPLVDADAPDDLGEPPSGVRVEPLVSVGSERPLPIHHTTSTDLGEAFFAEAANAVRQPGGADSLGLEPTRYVVGSRDGATDPFGVVALEFVPEVGFLRGDPGEVWTHFATDTARRVNEETITTPTIIAWRHGTEVARFPVPAGLRIRHLGLDSEGTRWVAGSGRGTTVIDGAPLGAASSELVAFTARLEPEGLAGVETIATRPVGMNLLEDAARLPDGDVLLALSVIDGGSLFGEPVADAGRFLVRVDPTTGSQLERWAVSRPISLRPHDEGVEILAAIPMGETFSIAGATAAALDPLIPGTELTTYGQIVWDGGDELPAPTRWPADPSTFDGNGVAVADWLDRRTLVRVDEAGALAGQLSLTGAAAAPSVTMLADTMVLSVASRGARAPTLVYADTEGSEEVPLALVPTGNDTLWVLELSVDSGALVRERTFDLGPETDFDSPYAQAHPLDEEQMLVAIRPSGADVPEVSIEDWDGSTRRLVTVELTGPGCRTLVMGPPVVPARPPPARSSLVSLVTRCDSGPHIALLAGEGFEYQDAGSSALYRVTVD